MEEKSIIQEISTPLYEAKGWMKLIWVMSIIYGVIMIFTIWGIIICWLPIWLGVLLFKAGSTVKIAQTTGDRIKLLDSLTRLATIFMILGILIQLGLIAIGIFIILAGEYIFLFSPKSAPSPITTFWYEQNETHKRRSYTIHIYLNCEFSC